MRIVIALEYLGLGFCGWQSQPSGCGVEDAVEAAVAAIAGERVVVTAAGRTDTGVHAAFQVAHFDTAARRPLTAWVRGVNSHLPRGVAVLWAREVDETFHARFAAVERGYRYVLLNHPVRPGLEQGRVGWHHRPLDAAAMNAAAAQLIGRHDFSAFRAAECQARSPVKDMRLARIERRGDHLVCDFRADVARALFVEHEAERVGSRLDGVAGVLQSGDAADLYANGHRSELSARAKAEG
jgi:tRNA pseudouridine38-40 synthase